MADPATQPRPRWWPAIAIVVIAAIAIAVIRTAVDAPHQSLNIYTTAAVGIAGILLVAWLAFASRMRWRLRLSLLATLAAAGAAVGSSFRIRGVSGDLLPILEPRWSRRENAGPSTLPAAKSADVKLDPALSDFPQFLGPTRNGVLPGPKLARDWTARPPAELWRQPIGAAWSGFAVSGGRAVTQETRGDDEVIACYEALTGRRLWERADPGHYSTTIAGEGPRATPTIASGRVFAYGALGRLSCLDLESGKVVWERQSTADNGTHAPEWGFSSSPLVEGGIVVVAAGSGGGEGRSLAAYRTADGAPAWRGGTGGSSYASPVAADLAGERQVVMFNGSSVSGHALATGATLWTSPFPKGEPNCAQPLILPGDRLIVSAGYGKGSHLVRVSKDGASNVFAAAIEWESKKMKSKFGAMVALDGFIYGLDDGILACVDLATGAAKWKGGRYGHGQLLLVARLLLLTAESGDIVLIEPAEDGPHELTRFSAFGAKLWNPPALAGELLLVRTDQEAACFRLPVEP